MPQNYSRVFQFLRLEVAVNVVRLVHGHWIQTKTKISADQNPVQFAVFIRRHIPKGHQNFIILRQLTRKTYINQHTHPCPRKVVR